MVRTETATVVFTDLVGSTELANRLGHDAYEVMRRAHFNVLRLAASQCQGIEIKSTGDGMVFSFGSAGDALACMIRMQQMTDLAARRNGGDPRIRIGASCGEINRDDKDHDIFGICVVEAARLCAAAEPGQILVADLVSRLVRNLGYRFGTASEFSLKGIADPVHACLVEWEPRSAPDGTMPLPPKIVAAPPFGLYGRAVEQATVARCWAGARQGQRQVVLLAGEPGIGKTRLAADAARIAHREGAVALFGSCDEDIGLPYRPFVEALRHYLANAPDEILVHHVREHQGELLRMIPELSQRVPNIPPPRAAEPETERFLMFEAFAGLVSAISQHSPVVLILDDLQWAGTPELLLLKHIVRSAMPMHLLTIVTYRDTELSRIHPLASVLADLRRETGIERIALRGLDEAGVIAFVTAAAGHDLGPSELAVARTIAQETEGSPLFIAEILRNLSESGAVFRQGDRWALRASGGDLGIPQGVKEAIGRRLSRLTDSTNKVLSLASVIGREFDLALLEQIAEMPEEAILDAIDEAKAAALVAEVGGGVERYAFTHALVRATLYDEISPARRARMHRRVGTALERLTETRPGDRLDELTRHWMAATTIGDLSKAIAYARLAAEQALAGLAFEEAAKYYEQALAALPDDDRAVDPLRCDLMIALSDAQRRAGEADYHRAMTEAVTIARALADPKRLAMAVLVSARPGGTMANATVVDHALIALYEEALAGLHGGGDDVLRAKLLAQLSAELLYAGDFGRRHRLSAEAVTIARRSGDQSVLAFALYARAVAINVPAALDERLTLTAELEALAERSGSIETLWSVAYHRFGASLESGDIVRAEQMLARLRELIPKLRQPYFNWATSLAGAMLCVMRGTPDAEQQVLAAFELGRASGQPDANMVHLGQLFVIRRDQGRFGELVEPLRQIVQAQPHLPVWGATLAGLYCETDQLDQARAQMATLAEKDFELPVDWTWPSVVMSIAQVASDLGDQTLAAHFYRQLQKVAGQVGVTTIGIICYGSLALPCAQLAACLQRWDEADRYFGEAEAMNERIGARPYLVRTRRAWAAMLIDRNAPEDGARIVALMATAREAAVDLGMQREIVRLDRLGEQMSTSRRATGL
jgi:class 3 adenylate cyclase/tetratricopeptide (TPR) repeat protein